MPYLAWNGEQVRLERCVSVDPIVDDVTAAAEVQQLNAQFTTEAWTGGGQPGEPDESPSVTSGSTEVFFTTDYNGADGVCAEGDVVSLFSGLANIELNVTGSTSVLGDIGLGSNSQLASSQILVAWMTLTTPTLSELSSAQVGGDSDPTIGDPGATGTYQAGDPAGYLSVKVKGTLPTQGYRGLPSTLTLPDQWSTMASDLAETNSDSALPAEAFWDTSGDDNPTTSSVPDESCLPNPFGPDPEQPSSSPDDNYLSAIPQLTNDNVDNCAGGAGSQDGPFSTVFGTLSGAGTSVGPYDPVDPGDTYLPDGNVNAQDAPMPAALVTFNIAPNSSSDPLGGVGSLSAADKQVTYSQDFSGDASEAHNLYAPFYDEYIPSTARPGDVSSGIDGALDTQDFPGFTGIDHEYHFWDTFNAQDEPSSSTSCLEYSSDSNPENAVDPDNTYYQTPSGQTAVTAYTDEHGEAQVQYTPGMGFYFGNLGITPDGDNGCDLQSLYGSELGDSQISATANYPYKQGPNDPTTSNTLTKTVTSDWTKTLTYFPKAAGSTNNPADGDAEIVVAHAQGINGRPFAGETVCFTADNGGQGLLWYDGTVQQSDGSTLSFANTSSVADPKGSSFGRVCVSTDQNGNAAVEVDDSAAASVDVLADFTNEGILRDRMVPFNGSSTTGNGPNPVTPGGSTGAGDSTDTGSQSSQSANSAANNPAPSAAVAPQPTPTVTPKPAIRTEVILARVIHSHGRRYLELKVRSASNARIRVVLRYVGAEGTVRSHAVTVPTNRLVKISLSKGIGRVKSVRLG